jgi:hypothetical protein
MVDRVMAAADPNARSWVVADALRAKLQMKVGLALVVAPLTANHSQKTRNGFVEPTRVVEFLLLRSLPDHAPIVVKRELWLINLASRN